MNFNTPLKDFYLAVEKKHTYNHNCHEKTFLLFIKKVKFDVDMI